jgi:hypothetical protein
MASHEAKDRLRGAQAEIARAEASLAADRREEALLLINLHESGLTWFRIAAANAPISERKREAERIRAIVSGHRRVTGCHGIRSAGRKKPGKRATTASPSICSNTKEASPMTNERLIRRTVTTEEIFGTSAGPAPVIHDDDDAIDDDIDDAGAEAMHAARPQHRDDVPASRETNGRLANYFQTQKPRFDRDRFLRATETCKR